MFLGIGAHSRHAEFLCLAEYFRQKNIRTYLVHADGADTRRFFLSHTLTEFLDIRTKEHIASRPLRLCVN